MHIGKVKHLGTMGAAKEIRQEKNVKKRCWWCSEDPLYTSYHDEEWGRPVHDDLRLFEFLTLEGFQAGLSWITILRKRENFRKWIGKSIFLSASNELEPALTFFVKSS